MFALPRRSAAHNNCLKIALAPFAASRDSQKKKKRRESIRGDVDMLDAIQISLALWAMIVCGGVKLGQVLHCLF
jgi:hypothetical protein